MVEHTYSGVKDPAGRFRVQIAEYRAREVLELRERATIAMLLSRDTSAALVQWIANYMLLDVIRRVPYSPFIGKGARSIY